MGDLHQPSNPRHACCWNAQKFLRAQRGSGVLVWTLWTIVEIYQWKSVIDVLYCPWCGVELLEGE